MRSFFAVTLVFHALGASAACAQQPASQPARETAVRIAVPPESLRMAARAPLVRAANAPSLIVFITVDQLREDYIDRYRSQLTGGLARLARDGAFYTNAYQDHGVTETAPGHASTMSGRFPRSTGIFSNRNGVNNEKDSLIATPAGLPAGPERFRGTTLTDWLIAADPTTRVLSVSRKDRGAILPIGKSRQPIYWYAPAGMFTTSRYYADTLPTWVRTFNARKLPQSYAGKSWTLLRDASMYTEPDTVPIESGGQDFVFPHLAPADSVTAGRLLPNYPWMDSVTAEFALAGVKELGLGNSANRTDMLAVSFSTTDAVGHRFGPDSREIHDQILRLDKYLGMFLDSLFRGRDSTKIVIALTADHGVNPFPEVKSKAEPNAGAKRVDARAIYAAAKQAMADMKLDDTAIHMEESWFTFERDALAPGTDVNKLADAVARKVKQVPGVMRADTPRSLASADTVRDAVARRWVHMFPPESTPDILVTLEPHNDWLGAVSASHGSPNDYDAHVPIIFWGRRFKPGRYSEFARVVDMAPTLAVVAGVSPTERLDGHVLMSGLSDTTQVKKDSH